MNNKLHAIRCNSATVGSCNFCNIQHKEVMQITGDKTLTCRMCYHCIEELTKATKSSFLRPLDSNLSYHPATVIVSIKKSKKTIGWWYNSLKEKVTVRDCKSNHELRDIESTLGHKVSEFYIVDNGVHAGNVILKEHTTK